VIKARQLIEGRGRLKTIQCVDGWIYYWPADAMGEQYFVTGTKQGQKRVASADLSFYLMELKRVLGGQVRPRRLAGI
jgi:hypothetical protein